jgi:acyl-coenzyme A thioesterase PaaI-like protein
MSQAPTTTKPNKLQRIVNTCYQLPNALQTFALSTVFGRVIKFAGTAGVEVLELKGARAVLRLKNRKKAQNHIGSVHAAATGLLAESATGFLVGIHLPDNKLPLLKQMQIDYVKRSTGDLTAIATLTEQQIAAMHNEDKGEVAVAVTITDSAGITPVNAKMTWAWIPKKR